MLFQYNIKDQLVAACGAGSVLLPEHLILPQIFVRFRDAQFVFAMTFQFVISTLINFNLPILFFASFVLIYVVLQTICD